MLTLSEREGPGFCVAHGFLLLAERVPKGDVVYPLEWDGYGHNGSIFESNDSTEGPIV